MAKVPFADLSWRPQPGAETAETRIVLHVGCGYARAEKLHPLFRTPNWRELRLDIDPAVGPDVIASMTDMGNVPAASVHAVWSSHSLEHLYAHEVAVALREFNRVLVPGGFVLITVPDLASLAHYVAEGRLEDPIYMSPAGPISAIDILFGCRALLEKGKSHMAHRTGFSSKTLASALHSVEFAKVIVKTDNRYNLWAVGYKGESAV
jgi:SAM-dependent methyltransferase